MTILYFSDTASGRRVSMNTSLTRSELIADVTNAELATAIKEYEQIRLAEYWNTLLTKSSNGDYIVGLESKIREGRTESRRLKTLFFNRAIQSNQKTIIKFHRLRRLPIKEQRTILALQKPTSRVELCDIIRYPNEALAPDFLAILESCKTPAVFIDTLIDYIAQPSKVSLHPQRYFELLTYLWGKNWILLPLSAAKALKSKWSTLTNQVYGGAKSKTITSLHGVTADQKPDATSGHICAFFACTDIVDTRDLSAKAIQVFEEETVRFREAQLAEKTESIPRRLATEIRRKTNWLLACYNNENPNNLADLELANLAPEMPDKALRLNGNFNWISSAHPSLYLWAEMFKLFIKSLKTVRLGSTIVKLNKFADFICSLTNPPLAPWLIERRLHIYDAKLVNHKTLLNTIGDMNGKNLNSHLATYRKFFNWLRDYLIASDMAEESRFPEPVLESDSKRSMGTPGVTSRNSLPAYVLNEIKGALIDDDFAFPKSLPRSAPLLFDNLTGQAARVFDPARAVCLYTLLDTPIRSHQSRWLDSGELDEIIYDPISGKEILNPSVDAIKGRREGVLRLQHDGLRADSWLSLWINTNKTASYDNPKIGYTIPYVSPKLAELLTAHNAWQKRYLPPVREPLSYLIFQRDVKAHELPSGLVCPTVAPLFRDAYKANPDTPIKYNRLCSFYTKSLEETQKRIEKKYGQKLKLVTYSDNGQAKWVIDLHSLRVSGITNLIEAGVPIEVVQQFVAGHQVLIMTLHYLKYSPEKLRQFIAAAHKRMVDDQDFVGSEIFIESLSDMAPFLLGQDGAGSGAGFDALCERDGIVTVLYDGICPGTSCSSGGQLENVGSQKYGPVPGGRRCGLCRYWLTGPAHLLGQITAVNNLAYAIRKKGLEVAELNNLRIEAEDAGHQLEARAIVHRIELLNRELEIDINEWAARYKYAEESIRLMDEYLEAKSKIIATDSDVRTPVLTPSTNLELKITLEQSHEFALLDQITQLSSFTTSFQNREADLEKNDILSRMMVANGLKPFLLHLSKDQAHEAANLISALLLQQVKSQELQQVLEGEVPLHHYPHLSEAISLLERQATSEQALTKSSMTRLAGLLNKTFESDAEQQGGN